MRPALLPLLLVAASADARVMRSSVSIDHVTLETNDLEKAMREFERRTGVKPRYGGAYPGRGFINALVGLGNGRYLEILGPDPGQADYDHTPMPGPPPPKKPPAPLHISPFSWAIRTHNAAALNDSLQRSGFPVVGLTSEYFQLERGREVSWVSFQIYDIDEFNNADGTLAYFVQWDRRALHPSQIAPKGCRLHSLAIATPRPAPRRRLIAKLGLQVQVKRETKSRLAISLDCPKGRVRF